MNEVQFDDRLRSESPAETANTLAHGLALATAVDLANADTDVVLGLRLHLEMLQDVACRLAIALHSEPNEARITFSDPDFERIQDVAEKWDCSASEAVRRLTCAELAQRLSTQHTA